MMIIEKAIELLSPKQKLYFAEYFFESKKIPEIAEEYGVNKSTVSRTLHKAIRKIQKVAQLTHIVIVEI